MSAGESGLPLQAYGFAAAIWDKIDVPFYSVGNWSGMGLHLRGNTEAFMRARSSGKKLRIHIEDDAILMEDGIQFVHPANYRLLVIR